ncbi:MAG: hypothetical protein MK041_11415 [Aquabacterium sp.]|nr:hypothetical protein [Aquabacterium sp.]
MNDKPIESARDRDLRLSLRAMQRAAQRARELAARTGTLLVVSQGGTVTQLAPAQVQPVTAQEPPAPYGDIDER